MTEQKKRKLDNHNSESAKTVESAKGEALDFKDLYSASKSSGYAAHTFAAGQRIWYASPLQKTLRIGRVTGSIGTTSSGTKQWIVTMADGDSTEDGWTTIMCNGFSIVPYTSSSAKRSKHS